VGGWARESGEKRAASRRADIINAVVCRRREVTSQRRTAARTEQYCSEAEQEGRDGLFGGRVRGAATYPTKVKH
jgi:hypothetical protein